MITLSCSVIIIMCLLLKIASRGSGTVLGSGLVLDDTVTWRKGEVLGRGAYGTVCILPFDST